MLTYAVSGGESSGIDAAWGGPGSAKKSERKSALGAGEGAAGTKFTCFTGKKVQILTLCICRHAEREVLSLLALLVQKYKC
jgi:hypothetical protein